MSAASHEKMATAATTTGAEMIACDECGNMVSEMSMTIHRLHGCRGRLSSASSNSNNNNKVDHGASSNNKDDDVIDLSRGRDSLGSPPPPASRKRSEDRDEPSTPQPRRRQRRQRPQGRLKRDADYDSDNNTINNLDDSDDDVIMIDSQSDDNGASVKNQQQQQEVVDLFESDDDEEDDSEWTCSRCTLLNDKAAASCEACGHRNPLAAAATATAAAGSDGVRAADPVRRERLIGGDDYPTYGGAPTTGSGSANSPLSTIGGGAIVGSVLGAAGAYIGGRPMTSGALEGGVAGALGGVFVNEMMRSPPSDNMRRSSAAASRAGIYQHGNSPLSQARSAGANGLPAYPDMGAGDGGGGDTIRRSRRQPRQSFRVSQFESPDGFTTTSVFSSGTRGSTRVTRRSHHEHAGGDPLLSYMLHSMMAQGGGAGRGGAAGGGIGGGRNIDNMSYDQLLSAFGDGSENMGASVGAISSLPTTKLHTNIDTGKVDLPEDACQCAICLEDFEANQTRKTLPCLHGFHEGCIDKWLNTNGACPVCKFRVDQRNSAS